jgi:aryl-alcohol dehydrogenase-like predicted oxidoreductase
METNFLGSTGIEISKLCFGTMSFGDAADASESAAMFHRCREAGINVFDTADVYSGGRSEEILGELIADCRDEVVLATKVYFATGDDPNSRGASRFHIVRAVEQSLRRLDTDRIDIYYLHRFDERTPLEETLRALEDLVRQGKILHAAVSNFAAWQVVKSLGIAGRHGWSPIACIQPMYNLVKRQAEVEILPMAASEQIGVMPYSPLGGGLLTGKYSTDDRPDQGRLVDNEAYQTRYGARRNFEVAERFTELAAELGHHPVSLAVAWVAAHPAVSAPIIGARNVEQLEDSLAAAEIDMDAELRSRISALSPAPPPATDRNEEFETGGTYAVR